MKNIMYLVITVFALIGCGGKNSQQGPNLPEAVKPKMEFNYVFTLKNGEDEKAYYFSQKNTKEDGEVIQTFQQTEYRGQDAIELSANALNASNAGNNRFLLIIPKEWASIEVLYMSCHVAYGQADFAIIIDICKNRFHSIFIPPVIPDKRAAAFKPGAPFDGKSVHVEPEDRIAFDQSLKIVKRYREKTFDYHSHRQSEDYGYDASVYRAMWDEAVKDIQEIL
jgi:hypothetical protein